MTIKSWIPRSGQKEFLIIKGSIRTTSIYDLTSLFEVDVDSSDADYLKIRIKNLAEEEDIRRYLEAAIKKTPIS